MTLNLTAALEAVHHLVREQGSLLEYKVTTGCSGPTGLPGMTSQPPSVGSGCPFADHLFIHPAYLSGLPSCATSDLLDPHVDFMLVVTNPSQFYLIWLRHKALFG
jgi:hypothetical protein